MPDGLIPPARQRAERRTERDRARRIRRTGYAEASEPDVRPKRSRCTIKHRLIPAGGSRAWPNDEVVIRSGNWEITVTIAPGGAIEVTRRAVDRGIISILAEWARKPMTVRLAGLVSP